MRKSLLVILLCLMLPAFGGISCYAAIKDWDKILDKYEKLCESCLQMKMKAESGEKVSKVSLGRLFSSLSELRGELKSGSGSMSVSQRERFEQIRTRYSSLFGIEETQDEAAKPESPSVKREVHKTISAAASSRQQGSAGHIATRTNETKVEEDTLARERLPLSELPCYLQHPCPCFFAKLFPCLYSLTAFFLGRPRLTSFFSIVCLFSIL